jgi:hypothetical protein
MAVAAMASGCGTQRIAVAKSSPLYAGAQLFSQRCSGCHSLAAAAANGSASNIRTAQANSGPNFNVRCERPITRVLYAIENGGFSGAYMPQNIVVGQDAINVAKFVSTYAGRAAPKLTGVTRCQQQQIGTLPSAVTTPIASAPAPSSTSATTTTAPAPTTSTTSTKTSAKPHAKRRARKKKK